MSLIKLFLAENKLMFPGAREKLVSDIPAGEGKIYNDQEHILRDRRPDVNK
jgi:hypothetical protein